MEVMYKRRSVREFRDEVVSDDLILEIIKAGMQAPSGSNQQPWEFIIVKDENLAALKEFFPRKPVLASPNIIVLFKRSIVTHPYFVEQDMSACAQNMLLKAVDLNLGACWISTNNESIENYCKTKYEVTDDSISLFCMIGVGYPLKEDANHIVDRFDESKIHINKF